MVEFALSHCEGLKYALWHGLYAVTGIIIRKVLQHAPVATMKAIAE